MANMPPSCPVSSILLPDPLKRCHDVSGLKFAVQASKYEAGGKKCVFEGLGGDEADGGSKVLRSGRRRLLSVKAFSGLGSPQDGGIAGTPAVEVLRDEFPQRAHTHPRAAEIMGKFARVFWLLQAFHDVQFGVVLARTKIG